MNQANLDRHRRITEGQTNQRINISLGGLDLRRAGGAGGADLSDRGTAIYNRAMGAPNQKEALKIVESAGLSAREEARVRRNVMDQFKPERTAPDLSGLSAAGKLTYQQDYFSALQKGTDPPDWHDPKYEKRAAVGGGGGGGGGTQPGKTVVGSDGHTYQQLPGGKWKVIK